MKTDELRERFLAFFETKGCVRRPSDVLVPRDDPTVLFTPAGMNQFKDAFLGVGQLDFTRAVTCQKCLRTGDIQNVGVTAYHHTFFEMLGNFSFGDYFKRETIHWAWEFLTDKKWLGLDPQRLSASVYEDDQEAYDIWHEEIKLPAERIVRDDENENFWPAGAPSNGPDGVCGPCSEIFYHPADGHQEVEIWNLVFTQFNRVGHPPDNLRPLPKKNIDTGMGLERAASVMQGVASNFEIDILKPLCLAAGEAVGVPYEFHGSQGRPLRRIADHIRAITFCIHEGVQPGNEKEAYVVRQLLRRALLEGYLLGKSEPFLYQLVSPVVEVMHKAYPELAETTQAVSDSIYEDENQFLEVIERGLDRFERCLERARKEGRSCISGDEAFDLHQTNGFLIELTEALAAKNNMTVDVDRFQTLMEEHKKGSGAGAFHGSVMAEGPLDALRKRTGGTEFLGYETIESEAEIRGLIAEKQLVDQLSDLDQSSPAAVVLDRSPFYGEAGGQVGDTGWLLGDKGRFRVEDTQRDGELLLHIGHLQEGRFELGQKVTARVDAQRRAGIRRAHSATHLLHHALRKTLGQHAMQRGSKVEDDTLRFDFSHRSPLSPDEIRQIEQEINDRIEQGAPVTAEIMDFEQAKEQGALALFGEKYPDRVRVIRMGDFSMELCGGTHLNNTGQVGFCRVVGEEPVAKGVRRVTALTGRKALERTRELETILTEAARQLKIPRPEDVPKRIASLQEEVRELKQRLAKQTTQSVSGAVEELIESAETLEGVKLITAFREDCPQDLLRKLIDQIRAKTSPVAVLLASVVKGKVVLASGISKDLVQRGVNASDCVKTAAKVVGGGGGGRPDLAEAGGRDPDKIDQALEAGAECFRSQLRQ